MSYSGSFAAYEDPNTAAPAPTDMDDEWLNKEFADRSTSRPSSEFGDLEDSIIERTDNPNVSLDIDVSDVEKMINGFGDFRPRANFGVDRKHQRTIETTFGSKHCPPDFPEETVTEFLKVRKAYMRKLSKDLGETENQPPPPPPPPGAISIPPGWKVVNAADAPPPLPPPSPRATGTDGSFCIPPMTLNKEASQAWRTAKTDEDRARWVAKFGDSYSIGTEPAHNHSCEDASSNLGTNPVADWIDNDQRQQPSKQLIEISPDWIGRVRD